MRGPVPKRIYLDHAATTPVHPEVVRAMQPYYTDLFGNPASGHAYGRQAHAAVERARLELARFLAVRPEEIVFTSGGTEANNLAVKGFAYGNRRRGNHIITTAIEHHSVLESVKFLARQGFAVTVLPVDARGRVDPRDVEKAIGPRTILVSLMHANNEVGTIQPVGEVADITRRYGICLHVDAVQTAGHLDVAGLTREADMVSLSAHKIHGPKGVGALYVRQGVQLEPMMNGGRQDARRRAGTEDVPAIIGFARAIRLVGAEGKRAGAKLAQLRDLLLRGIMDRIDGVWLNGDPVERLPGNLHLGFEGGVDGAALVRGLDAQGIAVSTGSACSSGQSSPSHVLTAMGLDPGRARSCIRFSLGRGTTPADIERVLEVLPREVARLRTPVAADGGRTV